VEIQGVRGGPPDSRGSPKVSADPERAFKSEGKYLGWPGPALNLMEPPPNPPVQVPTAEGRLPNVLAAGAEGR
jgi:hypothetical protein